MPNLWNFPAEYLSIRTKKKNKKHQKKVGGIFFSRWNRSPSLWPSTRVEIDTRRTRRRYVRSLSSAAGIVAWPCTCDIRDRRGLVRALSPERDKRNNQQVDDCKIFSFSFPVSMGRLCSKRNGGSLTISPSSATSIVLDSFNHSQPCRVEVATPSTHHISMLFTPRRRAIEKMTSEGPRSLKQCPLTISYVS